MNPQSTPGHAAAAMGSAIPGGWSGKVFRGSFAVVVASVVAFVTIAVALLVMGLTGFLPLSGFEGQIIRSVEERMGPSWKIAISSAVLTRVDGRSAVRISDVYALHAGGMSLRAPEAVLNYDPWGLLTGTVRITGIDLRGVNAKLGLDADGALILDAGSKPVKLGTGIPAAAEASDPSAMVFAILSAVDLMAREEGELFALETARLTGAKLSLIDRQGVERIGFDNVDIGMKALDSAARRIDISARGAAGLKEFSIDLRAGENNRREASLDIRHFEPSDIFALVLGDKWGGFDGFGLSGRVSVETAGPGTPLLAKLDLNIAAGMAKITGLEGDGVKIDGGKIRISFDNSRDMALVEEISVKSGSTDVALKGEVVRSKDAAGKELGWAAKLKGKGVFAGEGRDAPVTLDDITLALSGLQSGDLLLERLDVTGKDIGATMKGIVRSPANEPSAELYLGLKDTQVRNAMALWPKFVSPEARKVIGEKASTGLVEQMDLNLNFSPEVMKLAQKNLPVPDEAIKITLKGRAVTFLLVDGLAPLTDAVLTATSTGHTLQVDVSAAKMQPERGRVLTLSEGVFTIADMALKRAPGRASFRTTGGVDALSALLASPALHDFAPLQTDASSLKGSIDLRSTIALPLADDVKPAEVVVVSSGTMSNVSSDNLLGKEKLEGANLRAAYDKGNLTLKGDGRVGGLASQIDVRLDGKGVGEAGLNLTLDQQARQKRGLNLPGVAGPVLVKLNRQLGPKSDEAMRIEADLSKASIDGLIPGWNKPAGRAAKLSFVLNADKDGTDLDDFQFESAPVMLRGKVSLGKEQGLESAAFSAAKFSPGDDIKLDLAMEGSVTKATVRGKVFDARPFMKVDGQSGKDTKNEPDIDLDLSVPIVTGFNNEALGNAVIKFSRRQGEFRSLSLDGKIGRAPVTARLQRGQGGSGSILIETDDGGAMMRFQDLYRRAYGGTLIMLVPQGNSRVAGTMLYRDFVVRNEPALRRVLAEGQTGGIGGDRAVNAPRNTGAAGTEVSFTKLKVDFTRSASRIDIQDAVIWGPLLGFTAQGSVDFGRDKIDIGGTFIPSYAFNNAFSQVPIFGRLLGGGQNEGLFAVNFRLSGSPAQPTMNINPLSAIAPGILRRFVDPGGGTPVGDIPALPRAPAQR